MAQEQKYASHGHFSGSNGFISSESSTGVVPDLPSFGDFIQSTTPTVVMRDKQLEKRDRHARAQLRSIPLFKAFGIDTVIHGEVLDNDFKLIDYNHIESHEAIDRVDELEFPLVHITSQEAIEEYGEEDLVRALLNRSVDEGGRYILVTDTIAPRTPTYTKKPGRSVADDFDVTVKDYEALCTRFLEEYLDSALPVATTKNLYYHRISTCHKHYGAPASTLEDIFDYTQAPTESPAWQSLYYFIEHDLESILDDYSERIRSALRSWTERGETQYVANNMLDALRVCDYERAELEDYRQTNPEVR